MEESEEEREHRTGSIRVDLGVRFVLIEVAAEIVERIELGGGVGEAAELGEGENIVGEVGEVVVRFGEEIVGARLSDLVEDGAPGAAGGEVLERGELVG